MSSKTNQYGRGTEVFLGTTADDICLAAAVRRYIAQQGVSPGPFFRDGEESLLTRAKFMEKVLLMLGQASVVKAATQDTVSE